MRRQLPVPSPRPLRASGDRWLFGYADVVTLLFACFAALYAGQPAAAAARPPRTDIHLAPAPEPPAPPPVDARLASDLAAIAADARETSIEIDATSRGLVLSLAEAGSFPAGRADLTPAARRVMLTVADALRRVPNQIRVEGHTDDTPVRPGAFRSNWDLSAARATEVVLLFREAGGLAPERLSAVGYAEFRPRVPNETPELRARNRRVDIVVLGEAGGGTEAPGAGR
jgi:chemotaxis protein MotB